MAVRRWRVTPDQALELSDGDVIPMVSRDKLVEAVLDGVSFLDRSGGVLTIIVGREPTDLQGEAVTTNAVVEWKDGPRAKPQAEAPVTTLPTMEPVAPAVPAVTAATAAEAITPAEADGLTEARAAHVDDIGDGLDTATLEEEDASSLEGAGVI